jgi:hypothetical protein
MDGEKIPHFILKTKFAVIGKYTEKYVCFKECMEDYKNSVESSL